jgi:hypothetical protein
MLSARFPQRPNLQQRFENYLFELNELREIIEETRALYEETQSERALALWRRFEWMLQDRKSIEEIYQAEELHEFRDNPGKWAHSVRTWYLEYRDKELEL